MLQPVSSDRICIACDIDSLASCYIRVSWLALTKQTAPDVTHCVLKIPAVPGTLRTVQYRVHSVHTVEVRTISCRENA